MTEQPDTAEYRDYADMLVGSAPQAIRALCDALDAARDELDNCWQDRMESDQRAEAAEARIAEYWAILQHGHCSTVITERDTAEARIAAALDICRFKRRVDAEAIERALTEGTGSDG